MEALATIPLEVQATFAGVLIVALVTVLEILDLRRAIRGHEQKIQELSGSSAPPGAQPAKVPNRGVSDRKRKYRVVSLFSLTLEFIFGLAVLAVFSGWTYYLVQEGFIGSAIVSGLTAVLGIVMLFAVWLASKRKNKEMAQRFKEIESRPVPAAAPEKAPTATAPRLAGAELDETQRKPVAVEKTVIQARTVSEPESKLTAAPEPAAPIIEVRAAEPAPSAAPVVAEVREKVPYEERLPEDSMLRRHYLTHMRMLKQPIELSREVPSEWPSRPTDSMLRRHYDSWMAVLQSSASAGEPASVRQAEPAAAEVKAEQKAAAVQTHPADERLPEDSMLRRHYLSALRYRLESVLPPCPTDSMLKRHFDNWKNVQLDREIAKYVEGTST